MVLLQLLFKASGAVFKRHGPEDFKTFFIVAWHDFQNVPD